MSFHNTSSAVVGSSQITSLGRSTRASDHDSLTHAPENSCGYWRKRVGGMPMPRVPRGTLLIWAR